MIGSLTGKVTYKKPTSVVIDVGGVGYQVHLLAETLQNTEIGSEIKCLTYLAVRENALDLYGFTNSAELDFFTLLIGISGIGPKSAMAILSLASPDALRQAVAAGDTSYLTKIAGIGRKSADKIVLELKDKIGQAESGDDQIGGSDSEVLDALVAIGFSVKDAREAIKKVSPTDSTNDKIKEAIKILGNQ